MTNIYLGDTIQPITVGESASKDIAAGVRTREERAVLTTAQCDDPEPPMKCCESRPTCAVVVHYQTLDLIQKKE